MCDCGRILLHIRVCVLVFEVCVLDQYNTPYVGTGVCEIKVDTTFGLVAAPPSSPDVNVDFKCS